MILGPTANWSTFATWASKQAGQTIRKEDLARTDRASDAVARGNRKVFEEIGREFARFLALGRKRMAHPQAVDQFCDQLRPGDAPEGQRHLVEAFKAYHRALLADHPKSRAEWTLLGNLLPRADAATARDHRSSRRTPTRTRPAQQARHPAFCPPVRGSRCASNAPDFAGAPCARTRAAPHRRPHPRGRPPSGHPSRS